jgi:hypothetical protein
MFDPYSITKNYYLSQWVSEVVDKFSEYSPGVGSWGAVNLIGPPKTFPRYGDISSSWAPQSSSGTEEYLVLRFSTPVYICGIDVFETWNPGCVVKFSAFDGQLWHVIWQGEFSQPSVPELPRVFSPPFSCTSFRSNLIRIDLDCINSRSWTEIDCVRLRGRESLNWTPGTHCRYPIPFRRIVYTVLLCVQRLVDEESITVTQDVLFLIFKYLATSYRD